MNHAAAFLSSGRTLSHISHVLALLAGYGWFSTHHPALATSLVVYAAECYIALRVAIDAALLRGGSLTGLDEFLLAHKLRSTPPTGDRIAASLRWWKLQIAALVLQALAFAVGAL